MFMDVCSRIYMPSKMPACVRLLCPLATWFWKKHLTPSCQFLPRIVHRLWRQWTRMPILHTGEENLMINLFCNSKWAVEHNLVAKYNPLPRPIRNLNWKFNNSLMLYKNANTCNIAKKPWIINTGTFFHNCTIPTTKQLHSPCHVVLICSDFLQ